MSTVQAGLGSGRRAIARVPERVAAAIGLLAVGAFVAVGARGVYSYVDNYWLYRGYPPPRTRRG